MQNNELVNLKPYLKKFILSFYAINIFVIIIGVVIGYLGIDLSHGSAVGGLVVGLIGADMIMAKKFIKDNNRFFTDQELKVIVWRSSLLVLITQALLGLACFIFFIILVNPVAGKDINEILALFLVSMGICLAIGLFLFLMIFLLQKLNFRSLAKRYTVRGYV